MSALEALDLAGKGLNAFSVLLLLAKVRQYLWVTLCTISVYNTTS
jgi:hypothetical protein